MNLLLAALIVVLCGRAQAKVYATQAQAIRAAFPARTVARKTLFLSAEQAARIEALARVKVDSRVVTYYVARDESGAASVAFFDRGLVRTMPMTYAVVVKAMGEVERVEILSFDEPDDYLPPARWLGLYRGRPLNNDLAVGRGIPHITGASLTSQAVNDGVRRALATFAVALKGSL